MAKKKLDIKELLLQKGERIGLVIAVLVMVVLVAVGTVSALSNDSPASTTEYLDKQAGQIVQKLQVGPVSTPPLFKIYPSLEKERIPLGPPVKDSFLDTGAEDGKRLRPPLQSVEEGTATVARVQAMQHAFTVKGRDIFVYVLIPKETPKGAPVDPRLAQWLAMVKARYGDVPPQYKHITGIGTPGVAVMQAVNPDGTPVRDDFKIEPVPIDRIPPGAKMAERVQPYRMAIVTASFPYAAQVEHFRRALKAPSLEAMEGRPDLMPQFLPFNIQRRTLDLAGNVKEDWKILNYEQDLGAVLQYAVAMEAEDQSLRPLLFQNLHFPRPKLTSRTTYPPVKLKLIDETLSALAAKAGTPEAVKVLSPLEQRLRGGLGIFEQPEEKQPAPKAPAPGAAAGREFLVPRHCLVRFTDVTVQPGFTYEYQFQIRAKNPNEGRTDVVYPDLAKDRELPPGPWGPEQPIKVSVSQEDYAYAVEIDDATMKKQWPTLMGEASRGDLTFVQVHKWIDRVRVNPEQRNSEVPVGDWVIGDMPARRGEYVGRMEQAEVPVWFETRERFELAKPPPPPRVNNPLLRPPPPPKGIPVDFSTQDVLVDWEGGRYFHPVRIGDKTYRDVREDSNIEMLVLGADGKLRVQNSRVDSKDKDREQRYLDVKKWVEEVRSNKAGGTPAKSGFDPFKR